ncbi:uncharacterized protein LOC135484790 [Lineus longissimus]|uniref:uncharacterized protein LOC135484790 n=1 Tax=Lineus longissimus TaxID=88925 RepID=UPI00315D76FE
MDFCEALKLIYHHFVVTDNPILQDVYKVLINESFEEYRYFVHQMNTLSGISPNFSERLFECPACPQLQELLPSHLLSVTGESKNPYGRGGLYSPYKSVAKPKHEGLYFLDQDEVDKFVRSSDISEPNKDVDCNEFKAGSNIRSKGRYYKLDETAVFGASCRHDFPQMMFSLKHGERLSYPVYLLQQLMEKYGTSDISFMYDISCMFESYIKKHHSDISLDAVKMGIPIFHAYGHKWDCQVRYSPRRLPGFGLTDGESLERLWSYLRSFSKIAKEMTPSHRIDTLTDALIHYANRKQLKIGTFLRTKIDRAKDQLAAAGEELSSLLRVMQVSVTDVRDHSLREANRLSTNQALSGKEKTLHLLHKHCSERKILLETKKKYADGQAVAIKLQRSIARTNAQIRKYLDDLTKKFDSTLTFEKAVSCEFLIGPDARGYRHAEETLCLKERVEEEISLVSKEILNVAKVFCERHNHLTESLARVASKSHCKLMQGKMSLISSKIVSVEREFSLLQQSCGSIVPIIPDFQSYSQTLKTTSLR